MKKISIIALIVSIFISTFAAANEVNVFNARHYKADAELYSKFTSMTGIKVNLITRYNLLSIQNYLSVYHLYKE